MTTTPMSAARREELRVSAGFGTRGGINASEIEWLLQQAARAGVLRAEVDAWRQHCADKFFAKHGTPDDFRLSVESMQSLRSAISATDALEKETGHADRD